MWARKVKAIIITDNSVYETSNVKVYKDFILVDGVPYPKPKPHITEKCIYYIIPQTVPEDLSEKLTRLIQKKEIESIFNAITAASNPMRYLIYVVAGIFAGMYLDRLAQSFIETLKTMPPETAEKIVNIANIIAVIAVIAIPLFIFLRRRR